MKYLGIDFGEQRVGVAVSDGEGKIAFPRIVIPNGSELMRKIAEIIASEGVEKIVVGDTRSHGGAENPITEKADAFVSRLETETRLPVTTMWEMWSSIEASRHAPKKGSHEDAAAAAVILQRYLDIHVNAVE